MTTSNGLAFELAANSNFAKVDKLLNKLYTLPPLKTPDYVRGFLYLKAEAKLRIAKINRAAAVMFCNTRGGTKLKARVPTKIAKPVTAHRPSVAPIATLTGS